MYEKIKSFTCAPNCGFTVKSLDEREVLGLSFSHMRKFHAYMHARKKDVLSMIKDF